MYAVIRTGGKQYRVEAGQRLRVEKLSGVAGDSLEFPEVLMIGGDDGDVAIGTPTVENAKVVGEIVEQGRGRKVTVFKYKNKIRYRRVHGHRQHLTLLAITEIQSPDGASATYEVRRPASVADEAEAETPEAAPESEVEVEVSTEVEAATAESDTPSDENSPAAAPARKAAKKSAAKKAPARKAAKKAAAKKTAAKKTSATKAAKKAAKKAPKE